MNITKIASGLLPVLALFLMVSCAAAPKAKSAATAAAVTPVAPVTFPVSIPPCELISARVIVDDGSRLPAFFPDLYLDIRGGTNRIAFGEGGVRISGRGTFGAIPVPKNGMFGLSLRDGEYDLLLVTGLGDPLTPSDRYYVKSMLSGSTNLLTQKLVVKNGEAPPITITLTAGPR